VITVEALTVDQTRERWTGIKAFLEAACEKDLEKKLTAGGLYEDCLTGDSLAVEVLRDGVPVGAIVVSGMKKCYGRCMFVRAVGGVDLDDWMTPASNYLDSIARSAGKVDGIVTIGRPGLQKKLLKLGYKTVCITLLKEF
jgi:hypothetical protein